MGSAENGKSTSQRMDVTQLTSLGDHCGLFVTVTLTCEEHVPVWKTCANGPLQGKYVHLVQNNANSFLAVEEIFVEITDYWDMQ